MLRRLAVLVAALLLITPAGHADGTVHPNFEHPMGQMHYFDLTGFTVTISGQSDGTTNFVEAVPGSGSDCNLTASGGEAASRSFDCGGVEGRLRYTWKRQTHVSCGSNILVSGCYGQ